MGISRTSIYVAAGRAIGAREPDPAARNPNYLAETLLGDPSTLGVDHPAVRALSLSEFGLELREAFAVGGEESVKRYLTKADGTQVGAQALAEAVTG